MDRSQNFACMQKGRKKNVKTGLGNSVCASHKLSDVRDSPTLKSSRDDFNVLDNFNVSSIKTAICV